MDGAGGGSHCWVGFRSLCGGWIDRYWKLLWLELELKFGLMLAAVRLMRPLESR